MTNMPKTTYLKDYRESAYAIDTVDLVFYLGQDKTVVESTLTCRRQDRAEKNLVLVGENVALKYIALNGRALTDKDYQLTPETLTVLNVPDSFSLQIHTEIHPEKNTELSGLYRSNGLFCTQCEAQGFRRITYYLDRPDCMAKFTTTIHADKKKYPVLLSNGNLIDRGSDEAQGQGSSTNHWVKWVDPFKKPCYLFALVAGDLVSVEDYYVTKQNRLVHLKIYVERENQDKCAHAMHALKQAMKWDEDTYGREYDLDIYMIVAVNDFNMGAMENKGLNIFNSKYILARPETATDTDFEHIDMVVGHEYFHNWTGNRITCRDWFQLSLKEGLTVFREQQFSSDISKSAVSLIENANHLRISQFAEDAGPLSHPVRPDSYVEINNFYTTTIYEKGAEVIRMLKTLLGWDTFRKGMDLYFEQFDGKAATTDDFVRMMEEASGRDLTQFKLWYTQAGTPDISVKEDYDAKQKIFRLTLKQYCPPTPNQPVKLPMLIPVAVGLLNKAGKDMLPKTVVLELTQPEQTFEFKDIAEPPVLSILRGFSAPVKINSPLSNESLAFLLANDSDAFNRWEAGQKLSERYIFQLVEDFKQGHELKKDPLWFKSQCSILENKQIDLALKTEILTLPSTLYLMEQKDAVDIDALYAAKKFLRENMCLDWKEKLLQAYHDNQIKGSYQYNTENSAKRGFKNFALGCLMEAPTQSFIDLCVHQWRHANNMTDALGALYALLDTPCKERTEMLEEFYERSHHDPLLVNKWLRAQAMADLPETLDVVENLLHHKAFDWKNPNKVYALIGGFASGNIIRFHDKNGRAYRFLADAIIKLDKLNPQVASRMMDPFTRWKRFDEGRKAKMQQELKRIQSEQNLSKDLFEVVNKCLA